jgi:hypothetical protein
MKTNAEMRLFLAEAMNGASANLAIAQERLAKATKAVAEIEASRAVTKERYTAYRNRLALNASPISAEERIGAITEINACLEVLDGDSRTWQRARSEEGVARKEAEKFENELLLHATSLAKLLPEEV